MLYTIPHYYHKFHCVAGDCTDTCCAGWSIMIDDKSKKRYWRQKGGFGQRLKQSIDWKNSSFKQCGKRCAFLNRENLCDLYMEAGPDMLCKTCREYPRHTEEFEGIREISLSMSCEEAARIILGTKEPVTFLTKEDEKEEVYPEFDFLLFTKLTDARDLIISFLQDRRFISSHRMALVLGFAHDLQSRIRSGRMYEIDGLLSRYRNESLHSIAEKKLLGRKAQAESRFLKMKELFSIFQELEVLDADWPRYISTIKKLLFEKGIASYEENRSAFYQYLKENPEREEQWEIWCEQLLVYFVFTYFCGSVYDGQPYGKIKLAVVCTLLIQEMAQATFKMREGRLDFSEFVHLTHRFSREVEHSDLNLNALDRIFISDQRFGLSSLLSVL